MGLVVGIDIGGTFTDLIVVDDSSNRVFAHKELTTQADPNLGVSIGLKTLFERNPLDVSDIVRVVHATTLFTNAIIERKGASVALLTTAGFGDVVTLARERKYELYDLAISMPRPLCAPGKRFEVKERVSASGMVLECLDTAEVVRVARRAVAEGAGSLAVCFLNSFVNGQHEAAAAAAIAAELPNLPVSLSHVVANEIREYERFSTTIANAFIQPLADQYLAQFEASIRAAGIDAAVFIMLSSGGLTSIADAMRIPIRLLESGPAAGALAASYFAKLAGVRDLLAMDLGGTTAKLCAIEGGSPVVAHHLEAAREKRFVPDSGIPIKIPTVDLIEIGAGGGSIARRDSLGLLKVGPISAGSSPGPACYGRGGTAFTLTDANLSLGYLDPDYFAGGDIVLQVAAATRVLDDLAGQLKLTRQACAAGVHDLANESMAAAARVHAAERGTDPSRLALVVTGGGGPIHGANVARKLGIKTMLCPTGAGVASAIGLALAPVRIDRVRFIGAPLESAEANAFVSVLDALRREIAGAAGDMAFPPGLVRFEYVADVRYSGQGFDLPVVLASIHDEAALRAELKQKFEAEYRKIFTRVVDWAAIEVVTLRVAGLVDLVDNNTPLKLAEAVAGDQPAARQHVIYHGATAEEYVAQTLRWDTLRAGDSVAGPALIQQSGSTLVLGPTDSCSVNDFGMAVIQVGAANEVATSDSFDSVRTGLIWQRLVGVVEEASAALVRSSFSTVVRESDDYSVVITDGKGQLLAQATKSIPVFIASLPRTVKHFLSHFGAEKLAPGDVLITNDPWNGTGHLFDISVAMPLFRNGKLVAFAASTAHATDIGGTTTHKLRDIFEEGLQIPTRKLISAGVIDDALIDVIRTNVRAPEQVIGDLFGQLSALELVRRRLDEVLEEWHLDNLDSFAADSFERTDKAMRSAIRKLKPGHFSATQQVDGMERSLELRAAVTINADTITVDYAGSPDQIPAGLNSAYCYTQAFTFYALKCLLDPDGPNNEGATRALEVLAPKGSILNHTPPFSGSGRSMIGHYLPGLVLRALAPALPERVMAGVGSPIWSILLRGRNAKGQAFTLKSFFNGGMGALAERDGANALSWPSNVSCTPAEVMEQSAPLRVNARRQRAGSGGAGQRKGGDGIEVELEMLEGGPYMISFAADRMRSPAHGLFGGLAGATGEILLNGRPINVRETLDLVTGDRVTIRTPGGGGYGAPKETIAS